MEWGRQAMLTAKILNLFLMKISFSLILSIVPFFAHVRWHSRKWQTNTSPPPIKAWRYYTNWSITELHKHFLLSQTGVPKSFKAAARWLKGRIVCLGWLAHQRSTDDCMGQTARVYENPPVHPPRELPRSLSHRQRYTLYRRWIVYDSTVDAWLYAAHDNYYSIN